MKNLLKRIFDNTQVFDSRFVVSSIFIDVVKRFSLFRFRKLQLLLIASRGSKMLRVSVRLNRWKPRLEQQQCHQAELEDFFRLVDKRLMNPTTEDQQTTRTRLASILQVYEKELERLRQMIRTNEETVRSMSLVPSMKFFL